MCVSQLSRLISPPFLALSKIEPTDDSRVPVDRPSKLEGGGCTGTDPHFLQQIYRQVKPPKTKQ